MLILTLSCRSFSLSYQLFDHENRKALAKGVVERIELGDSFITMEPREHPPLRMECECPDHRAALALLVRTLTDPERGVLADIDQLIGIGHRVVHGGERFTSSVLIDREVIEAIRDLEGLAPLHTPANIAGMEAALELLPQTPSIAVFDTAFHQTMPMHAYLYALPLEWYEKHGIRRYGFHGPSHYYAARRGAALLGKAPDQCSLITIHAGNGVSLCAVKNGIAVDTSMGLTPLEGAVMATRCGDIDPGIPTFMMHEKHLSPREMDTILNQKSGVTGLSCSPDRHTALDRAEKGDVCSLLALSVESYRLKKYIGAYCAAIGPVDAIVFSMGEGSADWPFRYAAMEGMEAFGIFLDPCRPRSGSVPNREETLSASESAVKVFAIPANDELVYAAEVASVLAGKDYGERPSSSWQADFSSK